MLGCSHELYAGTAQQGLECPWWNAMCVRKLGVTVWQADSSQTRLQFHSIWTRLQQVHWEYSGSEKSPVWGQDRSKVKWRSQGNVKVQPGAVSLPHTSEKNQIYLPIQWAKGVQVESPDGTAQTLLLTPSLVLWNLDARLYSCVLLEQPLDVGKWTSKEEKRL